MTKKTDIVVPQEVAEFMAAQLQEKKYLYQEDIVYEIKCRFGDQFVYLNENGNPAITREVLKEFRRLTPDAIWERGSRMWRHRQKYDEAGSRIQE